MLFWSTSRPSSQSHADRPSPSSRSRAPEARKPSTSSPAKLRCLNAFRARRQTFTRTTEPAAVFFCDETWFLSTVASQALASGGLSTTSFRAAAEALGTSYQSPSGFGTRYGSGKHDGAAAFREFAFFADCTCYRYTSGVQAVA